MDGFSIPDDQCRAARLPLEHAATLPAACYTSADWHQQELARIFRREWVCLGRADEAAAPGDYFATTIGNEPILVLRDRANTPRAFSNVCRHRGCVIASGRGNSMTLQCPYHRWTYALTGALLAIPGRPHPMQEITDFQQEDFGLIPLQLDTWGGFVFVNLATEAPPMRTWLGDLPGWMDPYGFAGMKTVRRISHVVPCNWKVFLENSMEAYHVPFVHQRQIDPARLPVWGVDTPGHGPYGCLYSRDSLLLNSVFPTIPGLTGKPAEGLFHVWLQPNLQIIATTTYMAFRRYLPLAADRFELDCGWCFPDAALAVPGFQDAAAALFARADAVMQEDIEICPQVQAGLSSALYRPGRYAAQEAILHRIGTYVLDRVLGA
jgi:choline monooxygenase